MDETVYVGKIHIVEWLRPEDARTGQALYRELAVLEGDAQLPEAQLHRVSSRASFIARLGRIADDFRRTRRLPLLQIETHGDVDAGIGPSDKNTLTWPELSSALALLNEATGLRLIVVMAACHGIWGIKMAQPVQRAPFLALIGPNREVGESEVARSMRSFYRTLFNARRLGTALQSMNDVIDFDTVTFGAYDVDRLITEVCQQYRATQCVEPQLSARVDSLDAQLGAKFRSERGRDRTMAEIEQGRAAARRYLEVPEPQLKRIWSQFFMIDMFPENATRFPYPLNNVQPVLDPA